MANFSQDEPKPDGAAFDDFFDSIGNKAENLTIGEQKSADSTNGTAVAARVDKPEDDEPKIVDEIESLCMNCHENVSHSESRLSAQLLTSALRELPDYSSQEYPSFERSYSCPSSALTATSKTPRSNPQAKSNKKDLDMSSASPL